MKITRRAATIGSFSLLAGSNFSGSALADFGDEFRIGQGLEDFWLATDAYIFGYPLVTMEMTRRVLTNVARPEGTRGPMGQIIKLREYPNASFRDITAPNADTLYTTAFFDVGSEPWVLSIPDMKGRYALFPMLDGWTTVFQVPGKRTTGTAAQTYAITGPGWKFHKASANISLRPISFGSSAASTAPARRKTTRQCMSYRISSNLSEQAARSQLEKDWSQYSKAQHSQCDGLVTTGGAPSYVELVTCLEMAKQAKEVPEDSEKGTVGRR